MLAHSFQVKTVDRTVTLDISYTEGEVQMY